VAGEAGLGKTTVLEDALRRAESGFWIIHARGAPSEVGLPFGLVDQAFRGEDGGWDLDASSPEQHFYRALRQLRSLAMKGPVLVAVDDLQWSDPDSLSLFHYLVRRIKGLGVAVIATLRPWPGSAMDVVSALISDGAASLERLAPLSPAAVGRLLAEVQGTAPDRRVTAQVHQASGGNPLLVSQLAATIPQPAGDRASVTLSADLGRRYLLARFADVDVDGLDLLRAGCVLGFRFRPEVAAAMVGLSVERAALIVSGVQRAGILRERDGSVTEFVHDLIRQALYEDLSALERRHLHHAALRALDAHPAASAAEAAPHAIAADAVGDDQAIEVLERAAREAVRAGAVQVAKAHLEAAVALAGDAASVDLRIGLATVTLANGDLSTARHLAQHALMTASDIPPAARVAGLECVGNTHLAGGDFAQAEAWWRTAETEALRHSAQLAAATMLGHVGNRWMACGPLGAQDLAVQARDLAGDVDPVLWDQADLTARALGYLAGHPTVLGDFANAHERLFRAIDQANGRRAFTTSTIYGLAVRAGERFAESDAVMMTIAEMAERFGDPVPLSQALWHVADGAWRQGHLHRASELMGRACDLDDLVPVARPFTMALAALVWLDRGRLDQASELLAGVEPTSGPFGAMWLWLAQGVLRLRQGHPDQAGALLRRVADEAQLTGLAEPCAIPWATPAIQAAARSEAIDDVESILAWLEPTAETLSCRWPKGTLAYGRATLAEAQGQLEEAEQLHAQSVLLHHHGGQPVAHVIALIHQGAFLRRRGRAPDARQPLAMALQAAQSCHLGWFAEWARRELVQAGGRPSRRQGILTVQETAVARLAATGLGNPDIAKQLYISVRTVETHLGRVYTKLGIANRKQLQDDPGLLS
jgi:DNA-binding NarL/FixJ family response regulator